MDKTNPCESFSLWANSPNAGIATAGRALQRRWCTQAITHPQTVYIAGFVTRCMQANVSGASAALQDVTELASYIAKLEQRMAEFEGASA